MRGILSLVNVGGHEVMDRHAAQKFVRNYRSVCFIGFEALGYLGLDMSGSVDPSQPLGVSATAITYMCRTNAQACKNLSLKGYGTNQTTRATVFYVAFHEYNMLH